MPVTGVLKGRNPLRPDGTSWVAFAAEGPRGPFGPTGPVGPQGPPGAIGVDAATVEVWVNAVAPDPMVNPEVELWYDLDEDRADALSEIPPGGIAGAPLLMTSDVHGDVHWGTTLLLPTTNPGTVNNITTRNLTVTTLAAPTWEGDTTFDDNVSAESVIDPSYEQYLAWEELDVSALLEYNWHADLTIGPCRAWRNRYYTLVNLCLGCNPEPSQESWHNVAVLPPGWAPVAELWSGRLSVDVGSDGPTCEDRIGADGLIQIRVKALNSPDPQPLTTRYCVYYAYPRSG